MLLIEPKTTDDILKQCTGKTTVICCTGCSEVYYPEATIEKLIKELSDCICMTSVIKTDYICNPTNLCIQLNKHSDIITTSNTVLGFSCGVGIQTVSDSLLTISDNLRTIRIVSGCDTFPLPGVQGVTPSEYDCVGCDECHLNKTFGICPVTTCSKSLLNGQCGGSKDGKCEADSDMQCAWERIYRRALTKKHNK